MSASLMSQSLAGSRLASRTSAPRQARASVRVHAAARPVWLPGSAPAPHLDGSYPGDYGFDPLGLAAAPGNMHWFAEAERIHCRWAMLGAAGVLAQEIARPDIFWYETAVKIDLPFNIAGLVAFQIIVMHWTELRRGMDVLKPGSMDQDPIFSQYKLAPHDVGYPGGVFDPLGWSKDAASLKELKLKEIKNGRLAMLAYIGFIMSAQVTGKNPLAALGDHVKDPLNTTIFSKAVVIPGQSIAPPCMIAPTSTIEGITIPTPCFLQALWP